MDQLLLKAWAKQLHRDSLVEDFFNAPNDKLPKRNTEVVDDSTIVLTKRVCRDVDTGEVLWSDWEDQDGEEWIKQSDME